MRLKLSQPSRGMLSIALIIVFVSLACVADDLASDPQEPNWKLGFDEALVDVGREEAESDDMAFSLFEKAGGFGGFNYGQIPSGFVEEAVDPALLPCDSAASSGSVVGLVLRGSKGQLAAEVDGLLRSKGWVRVDGDALSTGASYSKPEGRITWLFLSLSEVSGSVTAWMVFR